MRNYDIPKVERNLIALLVMLYFIYCLEVIAEEFTILKFTELLALTGLLILGIGIATYEANKIRFEVENE